MKFTFKTLLPAAFSVLGLLSTAPQAANATAQSYRSASQTGRRQTLRRRTTTRLRNLQAQANAAIGYANGVQTVLASEGNLGVEGNSARAAMNAALGTLKADMRNSRITATKLHSDTVALNATMRGAERFISMTTNTAPSTATAAAAPSENQPPPWVVTPHVRYHVATQEQIGAARTAVSNAQELSSSIKGGPLHSIAMNRRSDLGKALKALDNAARVEGETASLIYPSASALRTDAHRLQVAQRRVDDVLLHYPAPEHSAPTPAN
jgi:hypothetical protein